MQYRVDPKSGNRISALGLGCMRFPGAPGRPDPKTADAIIARAVEQGINYLDTAYLYPGNEACVGASLERLGLRDQVLLATKLPRASCKCTEDFDRYFDEQLRRLRTDHIDYYLMHNITSPAQWERVVALGIEDWIARQKAAGRIRQIGFSYHGSASDFTMMLDAYDWDFCQIQYNYAGERYQAGTAGLMAAAERGLAVFVMEPLLGGRLAGKLPPRARTVFDGASDPHLQTPVAWGLSWAIGIHVMICVRFVGAFWALGTFRIDLHRRSRRWTGHGLWLPPVALLCMLRSFAERFRLMPRTVMPRLTIAAMRLMMR